ncbi:hypothetical protein PYW08_002695 [Mythimna loreyi]|uniref:Uncharacterized protein n=1 Tax=Mythimna loreyi TaxID=667449 RepID=A0ACC2QJN4_9NEOP|nr:hypothetical protein PYW08_002695 [Mythimna loreyi]
MPRTMRSPPARSANTESILDTQSEPDLSTNIPISRVIMDHSANITARPGKRFRSNESCEEREDKFEQLKSMLLSWKADQDVILNKLIAEVAELKQQNLSIQKSNADIETSMRFTNALYEDMKARIETLELERQGFMERLCDLESRGSVQTIAALEARIDSMEQHARQCNIEICNVPDKRNENLLTIMESIGTIINYPVSQNDILSIHRVPHALQQDKKPKNIIVKLKSRIIRDNFLSAYRKKKSIKTDELGLPGTIFSVFINEHLTLKSKALFRKCKELAGKYGFKYVWVKNGTILVRERDGVPAFAVRCEYDLNKITRTDKTHV